jgi:hypothetical protein
MERYTYFDGGKWRLKIGDTEYSGDWVERLAAYEDTGLEPEDMKRAFNEDAVLKLAGQALGMSPDRLRDLAQAEKTGQLAEFSCILTDEDIDGIAMVYKTMRKKDDPCKS